MLGTPSTYSDSQSELRNAPTPPSNQPEGQEFFSQLYLNSLSAGFFRSESELNLVSGVPPVMMKVSFLDTLLVLGFSFYEAVVDGEFISRFFSWMIDATWMFDSTHITAASRMAFVHRRPIEAVRPADINRNMFSFYDWSKRPPPQYTPKDRLVCRLIEFKKANMLDFMGRIRRAVGSSVFGVRVKDEDYIVAIIWATIIHARLMMDRIKLRHNARLNILLPGEPHARRAGEHDFCYFGNSTVPTVAELGVSRMLFPDRYIIDHNFQYQSNCHYSIRGLSEAAGAIRWAINKVDHNYVRHLMGLKDTLQPSTDWAAYERGIDRHTTGTVFEDWSGYFNNQAIGLPYSMGRAVRMLPCADDKEEGKIVLLPTLGGLDASGNEIGWTAWVCLDVEVMPIVLRELDIQGWTTGGAAANMNTMESW
ncbi:hypothetical protein TrVGV298_000494 [Trichoderma virens]|nr:hypothetical protein TrVGV298_000494 [Trichoderma virens]